MSHTTEIKTELKFSEKTKSILAAACKKMGLTLEPWAKHKLFSSSETGFGVKLPGWRHPIVLNESGIKKDNYNEAWGKEVELKKFMRRVNAEHVISEARRKGYSITEVETDGEIRLTISGGDIDG